jgi:hypothetical protein
VRLSSALVAKAREDSAVFTAVAARDEQTGQPFELAPVHKGLHRLWAGSDRTVAWSAPEMGKSANLASYVAWRIGRDPGLRVGYLSATVQQAMRHLRAVAILLSSPGFARVFPGIRVERSTADELTIAPRPETIKDATCIAGAFDLSSMLGARLDLVLCDDVITREQASSQVTRDRAFSDYIAVTSSRVAPGGQIHCVGTAEHPDDTLHRLAKSGYRSAQFPVLNPDGTSAWPERWPIDRIEARRSELGPVRFLAAMLCEASTEGALCFQQEDLDRALAAGLAMQYEQPIGGRCVIGVDPALTITGDESGIVMVTIDADRFRHLVHVSGQRLHPDHLVNRVVELARINKATVFCESNAGGGLLADAIGRQVPCKPLSTCRQSKESRVEALSAELSSTPCRWVFRQPLGRPSQDLRKLLDDMATFSFDRHCGDRLAALLIAVEGVRAVENRPKARWLNAARSDAGVWSFSRITR